MTFKLKLPHAAAILAQRPLYVNAKEKSRTFCHFLLRIRCREVLLWLEREMKTCFLKIIIAVAICWAVFVFLLGFIPCAAEVDARNDYIARMERSLDLRKEFAAQGVAYYGMCGHVNSYYSSFLIHTDKPCELPPAVDNYFRNHPLRMFTEVEQILYSPSGVVSPQIYNTQYYW